MRILSNCKYNEFCNSSTTRWSVSLIVQLKQINTLAPTESAETSFACWCWTPEIMQDRLWKYLAQLYPICKKAHDSGVTWGCPAPLQKNLQRDPAHSDPHPSTHFPLNPTSHLDSAQSLLRFKRLPHPDPARGSFLYSYATDLRCVGWSKTHVAPWVYWQLGLGWHLGGHCRLGLEAGQTGEVHFSSAPKDFLSWNQRCAQK